MDEIIMKHSGEYKRKQHLEHQRHLESIKFRKSLISYLLAELMLKLVDQCAIHGLEQKRNLFLYSMKARLIQNAVRKRNVYDIKLID